MGVIKFIFKWMVIFFGLFFALMIGIMIVSKINMDQGNKEYANLRKSIDAKQAVSGMTPDQVSQAWGPPSRVTKGVFHGVQVEQWIYDATPPKYDDARYVGFREGKAVIISAGQPQP